MIFLGGEGGGAHIKTHKYKVCNEMHTDTIAHVDNVAPHLIQQFILSVGLH